MTEAEYHQQQLELQEHAYDTIKADIRQAVISASHTASIAFVYPLNGNQFTVTDLDGHRYTVTIEEKQ
jgi:hypothetical protein